MKFFLSRSNRVLKMIDKYLAKVRECIEDFRQCFEIYLEEGLSDKFDEWVAKTHRAESSSDDLRRELELTLYERALIPEARGDILGLIESVDRIPNRAESSLFQIQTEFLQVPEALKTDFRKLVHLNAEIYSDVERAINTLFQNIAEVRHLTNEIDKKESDSDNLERELIKKIFSSTMDLAQKTLLKELVIEIGNISDRAQETADRLNIIAAKRAI